MAFYDWKLVVVVVGFSLLPLQTLVGEACSRLMIHESKREALHLLCHHDTEDINWFPVAIATCAYLMNEPFHLSSCARLTVQQVAPENRKAKCIYA